MSSCPSSAVLDRRFLVTKLSSCMVLSITTGRLSIHLSTIMELSICVDMVSPFFRAAFISVGTPCRFIRTVPHAPKRDVGGHQRGQDYYRSCPCRRDDLCPPVLPTALPLLRGSSRQLMCRVSHPFLQVCCIQTHTRIMQGVL